MRKFLTKISLTLGLTGILVCSAAVLPVTALTETEIKQKVDEIFVLIAVDEKGDLKPIDITANNQKVRVLYGAYAPASAGYLVEEILKKNQPEVAKQIKFAPITLGMLNQAVGELKAKDKELNVALLPDLSQVSTAKKMFEAQGVKDVKELEKVLLEVPVVFLTDPPLSVTRPAAQGQPAKTAIPVYLSYQQLSQTLEDQKKKNPDLSKVQIKVSTLPALLDGLKKDSSEGAKQIQIVSNPEVAKLVAQILQSQRQKTAPGSTPTTGNPTSGK
jgi:hypothetical protein